MKSNVYIRADGNSQIGLGHLVRCIALAHMLKESLSVHFVCKSVPASIVEEIEEAKFSFLPIENEDDFFAIVQFGDFVVLDHYGLDSVYQIAIRRKGCTLVCIDDIHDKKFFASDPPKQINTFLILLITLVCFAASIKAGRRST